MNMTSPLPMITSFRCKYAFKDAINYFMGLNASSQRNNKKCLPFKDVNNYLKSLIRD
jgi:hypothetical protein